MEKEPLIIIGGPTASGKSSLAVELALRIGGEIISADSMQIYKGMDIGTAKITPAEMKGVPHYLVDQLMPDDPYNVVVFKEMALKALRTIISHGHIPILAGGTGFYIQALVRDIQFTENDTDLTYRNSLLAIAETDEGLKSLYDQLKVTDPQAAGHIHGNDKKRIVRALEYFHETGQKISLHNEEESKRPSPYNFAYFAITMPRDQLYAGIEKRIDLMMQQGLEEEVRSLKKKGYQKSLVSMQGLGYKELFPYIDGECSLDQAVAILKRDTRHFAKRQLTWFKREQGVNWIDKEKYTSQEEMLEYICQVLKEKGIYK